MEPFRRLAFFTVARDASFVTLAAATLMLAFSFEPPLAFLIGANVALLHCLGLVFRAWRLDRDEERITLTEPWRVLDAEQRPAGYPGRLWARDVLEERWLRGAKAAAVAAIVLSGSSLIITVSRDRTADITVVASAQRAGERGRAVEQTRLWSNRLTQIR